jgi:A/G-specific adenine glycosylase
MKDFRLSTDLKEKAVWFRRKLRAWFEANQRSFPWRDSSRTSYEIFIAEMMLRQTKADTVARIYPVFIAKYPNFFDLSKASVEEIQEIIKPLGLWHQRAPIFSNIAKLVTGNNGELPSTREDLQAINHIGQYISSVILTTFHGKSEAFIDVNTARVVDRFFGPRKIVDIRYDPYLKAVASFIVKNPGESLSLNWAVLDFAALVCKAPTPICSICPMQPRCLYFANRGLTNLYK